MRFIKVLVKQFALTPCYISSLWLWSNFQKFWSQKYKIFLHNNQSATAIQMANSSYRKLLVFYLSRGNSCNVLLCMKNGFKWQGICFIKHKSCVLGGFKFTVIWCLQPVTLWQSDYRQQSCCLSLPNKRKIKNLILTEYYQYRLQCLMCVTAMVLVLSQVFYWIC